MKKNILIILVFCCLIIGAVIENKFNLINFNNNKPETSSTKPGKFKWSEEFEKIKVKSPIDSSLQPAYFYKTKSTSPQPLIVSLHTWSGDYAQNDLINNFSVERGYNYIHPNFRGKNNSKDACCSELVISDIDAAISFAIENANVDKSKIYVIGLSGGGYATIAMFMKSKHQIKKFSSWVPLVDLTQWYSQTKARMMRYSDDILLCTESKNRVLNKRIAREKSPIYWKTPVKKLENTSLEIYTGIFDKIIPITHSINFYNKLVKDLKIKDSTKFISQAEKNSLLDYVKPLGEFDSIGGRQVMLTKETNNIKIKMFQGGHEMLEKFAFEELIK